MIRARVVADSLNVATNDRLVTMEWTYPRIVHAEALRHRMLSRNAASSRAIPVRKMMDAIRSEPARPVEWGTAKAGMQAAAPLEGEQAGDADWWWTAMAFYAVEQARDGAERLGLLKQVVNRLLEPFAHITELVSGTEWGNFFQLRISPYADPTLRALATAAARAMLESTPSPCEPGMWHIPYGDQMPEGLTRDERIKIATARCARISYLNHDGARFSVEDDLRKHDDLRGNAHWSPFEHLARAMEPPEPGLAGRVEAAGFPRNVALQFEENLRWCRNFRGWHQYRADVDNESARPMQMDELMTLVEAHGYPGY